MEIQQLERELLRAQIETLKRMVITYNFALQDLAYDHNLTEDDMLTRSQDALAAAEDWEVRSVEIEAMLKSIQPKIPVAILSDDELNQAITKKVEAMRKKKIDGCKKKQ